MYTVSNRFKTIYSLSKDINLGGFVIHTWWRSHKTQGWGSSCTTTDIDRGSPILQRTCWWKKSWTSWCSRYPSIPRVWYIPSSLAGFLPSTVHLAVQHPWLLLNSDWFTGFPISIIQVGAPPFPAAEARQTKIDSLSSNANNICVPWNICIMLYAWIFKAHVLVFGHICYLSNGHILCQIANQHCLSASQHPLRY